MYNWMKIFKQIKTNNMKKNNLHVFRLNTLQDHIDMWHNLDNDYAEGSDNWRVDDDLKKSGYTSQAEKRVSEIWKSWVGDRSDDEGRLRKLLGEIEAGHGDLSSQFQYKIINLGDKDTLVAISYLT